MLKRDNWTTQELVDMLRARILPDASIDAICFGKPEEVRKRFIEYNQAIEGLLDEFEACLYPPDVMGAFAYDTEHKEFVHIGQYRYEDVIECSR